MEKVAENIISDMWYTFAENIFNRIVEIAQLNNEQEEALRLAVLRPNDFGVQIIY